MLDHLSFLKAQTVHHLGDTLAGKQTHQFVFKRHEEHGGTRVSLTSGTAAQLAVHTTALMTLRSDNSQTSRSLYFIAQLDVRTTTGHISGNGHRTALTGLGHDVGLLLMQLGVQYIVGYLTHLEHLAQHFRNLYRCRTDQHRTAHLHQFFYFRNDSLVFLTLRLVNAVVHILSGYRTIGRDLHHIKFIDIPELPGLGDCRTGHTGQLMIHTEIVLQCNRSKSLGGSLHLDMFLGLYSLMQSVAPAATVHDTAGLLIHNLDLTVNDDIFVVTVEHGIGFQQLLQGVHALALHGIFRVKLVFLHHPFLVGQVFVRLKFRHSRRDIRHHEQFGVGCGIGQPSKTLICQIHAVQFLVYHEIQRFHSLRHAFVVVFHIDLLRLQHSGLDSLFGQIFNQGLVLGQCLMTAVKLQESLFDFIFLTGGYHLLGFRQILRGQLALDSHQLLHQRLILFEKLVVALRYRTRNNQRRTGIIYQHRVHLVYDGVVVSTLHQILRIGGHVVAQIIETELVVRTKRNICQISTATGVTVRLVLVYAVHTHTVEHIQRSHPFGVTLGQIVIHRDNMYAVSGQGVQEHRQRSHQCLSFSGSHLGNLSLMQYDTTEELHIIVDHIPYGVVSSGCPMVMIVRRVSLNIYEIVFGRQFTVEIIRRHIHYLMGRKTLCRSFHYGEYNRHHLV